MASGESLWGVREWENEHCMHLLEVGWMIIDSRRRAGLGAV